MPCTALCSLCLCMFLCFPVLAWSAQAAVTLAWDWAGPANPQAQFVVQRGTDGATWTDVTTLPAQVGTNQQWTDANAPAGAVVRYQVLVRAGGVRAPVSNMLTVSPGGAPRLDGDKLSVAAVDSEETAAEPTDSAKAIDGSWETFWHTSYSTGTPPAPPHWMVLDLGQASMIDGLAYVPRQDQDHGRIAQYEIALSENGQAWGTPVASGTWPDGTLEQIVRFAAKPGRFVRLMSLKNVLERPWTSVAEVGVYAKAGTEIPPPIEPPPTDSGPWTCTVHEPNAKTRILTCTLP